MKHIKTARERIHDDLGITPEDSNFRAFSIIPYLEAEIKALQERNVELESEKDKLLNLTGKISSVAGEFANDAYKAQKFCEFF